MIGLIFMKQLEVVINKAIEEGNGLALYIEMPGYDKPEIIFNVVENLEKKLDYYKVTYDDSLEHRYAKGIKIIGYEFSRREDGVARYLLETNEDGTFTLEPEK